MIVPTIKLDSLRFSDETDVALSPADIVAFIGPNNAGKSAALQEIQGHICHDASPSVIKSADLHFTGTNDDFLVYMEENGMIEYRRTDSIGLRGYWGNLGASGQELWPQFYHNFGRLFSAHIATETRITDSNPAQSIDVQTEHVAHPLQLLYLDDNVERRISDYFRRAFGTDLILDRANGKTLPLLVGDRPTRRSNEDRVSKNYVDRLRRGTEPLQKQGDGMRSFASVLLRLTALKGPSVLLLDEPEAFLYPAQARLLGEIIVTERPTGSQLFVATHSPDILRGMLSAASDDLRIIRLQREGNVNRVKELDQRRVSGIANDAVMNFSSVISGAFHERVIICESDADCMFYSTILNLPNVHGSHHPDVHFVHANGKDRIAGLADAMVALGVPVQVVADIDVLRDIRVLEKIVQSLGGNWETVEPMARQIRSAVEQMKPEAGTAAVRQKIQEQLDIATDSEESVAELRRNLTGIFRDATPWERVKHSGTHAIPSGGPTQAFQKLVGACRQFGLWIVPVGEVEGFCRALGGHGAKWVRKVLERGRLDTRVDLAEAREFVRELWAEGIRVRSSP